MVSTLTKFFLFVTLMTSCTERTASVEPIPVAQMDATNMVDLTRGIFDISAVFLSDNKIGCLIRTGTSGNKSSVIAILAWVDQKLKILSVVPEANSTYELYAVAHERILSAAVRRVSLYSADLNLKSDLRVRVLADTFPRSGVIGDSDETGWRVLGLARLEVIQRGAGVLMATSDDMIIWRENGLLKALSAEGRQVWSSADTSSQSHLIEGAGLGRLCLYHREMLQIIDLGGKPDIWIK